MTAQNAVASARVRGSAHPGLRVPRALLAKAVPAGLLTVAVGMLLPWMTVFHGTVVLNGFAAGGGTLGGLALGSGLLIVVARRHGWQAGRWIALGGAAVVVAGSLWAARAVDDYAADPGPAGALTAPSPGPGPWVLAAGTAVLASSALLRVADRPLPRGFAGRLGLAATAFAAGWIHLLLVPEHWQVSWVLGAGFLGAGALQLGIAAVIVERPRQAAYLVLMALNVALIALWLYAVFVGLPFGEAHEHGAALGWAVGAGEPIDVAAAVTKALEAAGAVWAGVLACRRAGTT